MTVLAIVAALLFADGQSANAPATAPNVIFVCEHGAAKSVIATAYFNKFAAERGLPYRATFRGTSPQDELSTRAVAGLRADGIAIPDGKPGSRSPRGTLYWKRGQSSGANSLRGRKCSRHIRRSDTISDTIRVFELSHWLVNN